MITERDLEEAILECRGQRNPSASTCIKLAAFLTIQRELYGKGEEIQQPEPSYSYAPPEVADEVTYDSGSTFSDAIRGRHQDDIWPIMDELMSVLQATNPRLFNGVMRKLEQ